MTKCEMPNEVTVNSTTETPIAWAVDMLWKFDAEMKQSLTEYEYLTYLQMASLIFRNEFKFQIRQIMKE